MIEVLTQGADSLWMRFWRLITALSRTLVSVGFPILEEDLAPQDGALLRRYSQQQPDLMPERGQMGENVGELQQAGEGDEPGDQMDPAAPTATARSQPVGE
ncbi:hypothetical protein GCM10010439_55470 [Actinocorallia aurantiaca]|uniref:Uncharacterized protein n=1 Tax=Actinocorallia aurantiaca TaxID=46204 RepID=A0ABN3UJF3_9ACTN